MKSLPIVGSKDLNWRDITLTLQWELIYQKNFSIYQTIRTNVKIIFGLFFFWEKKTILKFGSVGFMLSIIMLFSFISASMKQFLQMGLPTLPNNEERLHEKSITKMNWIFISEILKWNKKVYLGDCLRLSTIIHKINFQFLKIQFLLIF